MRIHTIRWVIALLLVGCGSSQPSSENPPTSQTPSESPPTSEPAEGERTALTQQDCEAQGGTIVGDIGDGATQRPDYVCPSGKPPLGNIAPPAEGPTPIEGAVCCPQ